MGNVYGSWTEMLNGEAVAAADDNGKMDDAVLLRGRICSMPAPPPPVNCSWEWECSIGDCEVSPPGPLLLDLPLPPPCMSASSPSIGGRLASGPRNSDRDELDVAKSAVAPRIDSIPGLRGANIEPGMPGGCVPAAGPPP